MHAKTWGSVIQAACSILLRDTVAVKRIPLMMTDRDNGLIIVISTISSQHRCHKLAAFPHVKLRKKICLIKLSQSTYHRDGRIMMTVRLSNIWFYYCTKQLRGFSPFYLQCFCAFYPRDVVSAVILAGWLAGWLDVTRRYCINTAKTILKLFRPYGSPIILISSDPCADTQFQGEPLQRGR